MSAPAVPLVLVSTAKAGGAERSLASLARHLPAHGFAPSAVLLWEPGALEGWLREAGCARIEVAPEGGDVVAVVRDLVRTTGARAVLSNKWDAHVHGGEAARAEGIPAVWWQQDIAIANDNQRGAAAVPAAVIVCSSAHAVEAQRRLTPGARIERVHLGAPVEALGARAGSGAAVRAALGWGDAPLVGIVGRLQRFKRQHVFLAAAALVARERADVRFCVVGGAVLGTEGDYPRELVELSEQLGLGGSVRFAGHQDDSAPWFDALDVAVHATNGEPFGLVLVEAMALGTPLVATALGGPTEIVQDGESGLLVEPEDPEAMASAILRILSDPALAARLAAGGRARAPSFSEERMTAEMAGVLRELL
jgi:glycosyltransferase involved in cell wall biosynthesis